jgi:uncharacterized protein
VRARCRQSPVGPVSRRRSQSSVGAARRRCTLALALLLFLLARAGAARAQQLPELTQPVNDFAHVIDASHAEAMDRMIRALQAATGDVVVVATVETFAPYGDIEEFANKLFENHGRGIGQKGKDNGLLVTVAVKDRKAWIEVGYALEEFVTDGFAGETTRLYMIPEFRSGNYGAGLEAGVARLIGRIADARHVSLENVRPVAREEYTRPAARTTRAVPLIVLAALVLFAAISSIRRPPGGPRRWGGGPWSGWTGGIGPFGGGGGFGGFGGGASGGGGGGGGW